MNTNHDWKLVPIEPTDEMEVAAENDYEQTGATFPRWKSAYAAMLNAAPPAPTSHPIPTGATGEVQDGLAEAQRLAQALFQRHFSQDDDYVSGRVKWEVLDDLPGVLSQIDNMVSGLVQPAAPAAGDALGDRDAAFEAVRKRLCALPRYSFLSDGYGAVRRVESKSGSWIGFDAVHELFDPVYVDAAIAQQKGEA